MPLNVLDDLAEAMKALDGKKDLAEAMKALDGKKLQAKANGRSRVLTNFWFWKSQHAIF